MRESSTQHDWLHDSVSDRVLDKLLVGSVGTRRRGGISDGAIHVEASALKGKKKEENAYIYICILICIQQTTRMCWFNDSKYPNYKL